MRHALRGALAFVCALTMLAMPAAAAPLVGVHPDNDAAKISRYLQFISPRKAEIVGMIVAMDSWPNAVRTDWIQNNLNAVTVPGQAEKGWKGPVLWTVPIQLHPASGSTLEQAAAGAYDGYYKQLATNILKASPAGSGPIYIRAGSEFNGVGWGYSWGSGGREQTYINAFRKLATAYRSVSPRFKFVWCFAIGNADPSKSYPGDDVVDVVDMDIYLRGQYAYGATPDQLFESYRTQAFGLEWQASFAAAHGKPLGFAEWGVGGDAATRLAIQNNSAGYFAKMAAWVAGKNFAYTLYWDRDADPGALTAVSDGKSAVAGTAYKAFLDATAAPVVTPPPVVEPPPVVTPPPVTPAPTTVTVTITVGTATKTVTFP